MEEDLQRKSFEEPSGTTVHIKQSSSHEEDDHIDPDQPPSPQNKPLTVSLAQSHATPTRTIHLTAPNTFSSIPSLHSFRYPTEANFIPEIANIQQDNNAAPSEQGKQEFSLIIPSYASWFSFDSISDVERKAFPDMLVSNHPTKSPELYKECRNYMVNAFRSHPVEYLTLTACRRHLAVDVSTLFRIHAFLEQWGLINYQIDVQGKPALIQIQDTRSFPLYVEGPKGLRKYVPSSQPSTIPSLGAPLHDESSAIPSNLSLYPNVMVKKEEPSTATTTQTESFSTKSMTPPIFCGTCGQQCGSSYYHCIKHPPLNVCKWCFSEGRFPSSLYSGDFVKLKMNNENSAASTSSMTLSGCWSDQESLYLLEGVEMYHDDWDKVANHVATKTREECILRFLELPIQDPYLFQSLQESSSSLTSSPPSSSTAPIPFLSSAANPVMALISFFASSIHPSIAAEAAKAAIAEYEMASRKKRKTTESEEGQQSNLMEDPEVIQQALKTIIGQSAVHARKIVEHEEERMKGLVSILIEAQLKKLDLKLLQVETIEKALMDERVELERQRSLLARDRLSFQEILEDLNKKEEQKATLDSAGPVEDSSMKDHLMTTGAPMDQGQVQPQQQQQYSLS